MSTRQHLTNLTIMCAAVLFVSGCGKSEMNRPKKQSSTQPSNAIPPKSTTTLVIEGFTGKTVVDAGQRTKAKVAEIDRKEKKKRDDINQIIGP